MSAPIRTHEEWEAMRIAYETAERERNFHAVSVARDLLFKIDPDKSLARYVAADEAYEAACTAYFGEA